MNGLGFERYAKNIRGGLDFERFVKLVLEQAGIVAFRSAGSHGCADVLALNYDPKRDFVAIQCKKHGRVRYVRDVGLERTTASARASAPSVGSPSSEGQDEEAST